MEFLLIFTSDGYGTKCCQLVFQGAHVYCTVVCVLRVDVLTKEKREMESARHEREEKM
jgi:hypothetical protein